MKKYQNFLSEFFFFLLGCKIFNIFEYACFRNVELKLIFPTEIIVISVVLLRENPKEKTISTATKFPSKHTMS